MGSSAPGNALERNDRVIAIRERTRVHVDIGRFAFAKLFEALIDVLVRHFGLRVGNFDAFVFGGLELGIHLEVRLEMHRFAVVKMHVGDAGRADNAEVLLLRLRIEKFGDQVLQHLLPDIAGKIPADQRSGRFAGPEPGQFRPS